jgi:hypothetical protein
MALETGTQFGEAASVVEIPTHTGLFETGVNEVLASRFNRATADLEVELSIAGIVHAGLVVGEVGKGTASGWRGSGERLKLLKHKGEVAVGEMSQEWVKPLTGRLLLLMQLPCDRPQIRGGVIPVKDLNGVGEEVVCHLPQPGCAIAEQDHRVCLLLPTPMGLEPKLLTKLDA